MIGAFAGGFAAGAIAGLLFSLYLLSHIKHQAENLIVDATREMLKIEGLPSEVKRKLLELLNRI
jgi:hypothetical protein